MFDIMILSPLLRKRERDVITRCTAATTKSYHAATCTSSSVYNAKAPTH